VPIWNDISTSFNELDDYTAEPGSPSADDVEGAIASGSRVVSAIFGVVVSVVGGIATLANGQQVPVYALGTTTTDDAELPPDEPAQWVEGVPNVALLGLGALVLVMVLR